MDAGEDDEEDPDELLELVVDLTRFRSCSAHSWVWYCDTHDAHGNADSEEEADAVAEAHASWWDEAALEGVEDPAGLLEHFARAGSRPGECEFTVARLE